MNVTHVFSGEENIVARIHRRDDGFWVVSIADKEYQAVDWEYVIENWSNLEDHDKIMKVLNDEHAVSFASRRPAVSPRTARDTLTGTIVDAILEAYADGMAMGDIVAVLAAKIKEIEVNNSEYFHEQNRKSRIDT